MRDFILAFLIGTAMVFLTAFTILFFRETSKGKSFNDFFLKYGFCLIGFIVFLIISNLFYDFNKTSDILNKKITIKEYLEYKDKEKENQRQK